MPPEPGTDITRAAALEAAERDADGGFPDAAFRELRRLGLCDRPPLTASGATGLLRTLAAVGRGDLSAGRIFEGHVNVRLLIDLFGRADQKAACLQPGGRQLYGVWNTDRPGDPVRLKDGRLSGSKTFCTGIDGLSHAVVTAETPAGRRMVIVPLQGLPVDRSWWRPLGMRASGSHVVDFGGVPITEADYLGKAGDYELQPWFSAGAMRFLAVQVGGLHGVLDITLEHLTRTKRAGDPHQAQRLARLGALVETGYLWLDRCARSWAEASPEVADEAVATVNLARGAVEAVALEGLELAERSVGAAGMIAPHALERRLRDLRTYLRQPNPDGAQASGGLALVEGSWRPGHAWGGA